MHHKIIHPRQARWLVFGLTFGFCLVLGALSGVNYPVAAAPAQAPSNQTYAGSEACTQCHDNIHTTWETTRHAQAFSAPIFQRDWSDVGQQTSCLECHTTGYDPATGTYAEEGVSCEACHGPFQSRHPEQPMPITPDEKLCGTCHKTTTDEWHASPHNQAGISCQECHNPHSQTPKADTVSELCGNCHKERGESFTHGTHANSGLECSNCHMYTSPRTEDPIEGLVPTGHTFTVGSDACIGCHQDTVHSRDEIIKLTGEVEAIANIDTETQAQIIASQAEQINELEAQSSARLYLGLIQGAIIGLITGGVAAWVVSKRIKVVEVQENE